ncbi:MAG: helix-turn-helix transcriptional regulator [Saprospiraceae bacterium]|nr:helix-turn-helix transcriptional regulator [Saprospiraceae bacterium]
MPELVSKIRFLREWQKLSQEYMAQRLGISQPAYSKLESGKTLVKLTCLHQIADILQCSTADLLDNSREEIVNERLKH